MTRKQLFNLLKIVISLALISWVISTVDLAALQGVFLNADFRWLGLALFFALGGVILRARRWQILLNALEVRVSLRELVNIYLIGFLFNNLLPSGLGGDAIRMMELNQHSERASDAVTSVLVDRMLGLFALLCIALVALVFRWQAVPPIIGLTSVVVFVSVIAVAFALINPSLYQLAQRMPLLRPLTEIGFVSKLVQSFQTYSLPALSQSFLVALVFNGFLIAMNVSIGTALGAEIALVHYLVFIPLAALVLLLPISVAGLGARETAYVTLFGQVGVPAEIAFGMSLLVYAIGNLTPGLLGGVVYFWRGARGLRVDEKVNEQS